MQKVKPLVPPKPKSYSRLKHCCKVENSSFAVDACIVENRKHNVDEMIARYSALNEAKKETCSPKPQHKIPPSPKPKPRPKNDISEGRNHLSGSSDQLNSESALLIPVSTTDTANVMSDVEKIPEVVANSTSCVSSLDAAAKTCLVDCIMEEKKDLPISNDSNRLYRSPSYEKALEDNLLELDFKESLNSEEDLLAKRNHTVSSNLGNVDGSCQNVDGKILSFRQIVFLSAERELNSKNEADVATVCSCGNGCIQPTRPAPPPPSRLKSPLPNSEQKFMIESASIEIGAAATTESVCFTPDNVAKFSYTTIHHEKSKIPCETQLASKPDHVNANFEKRNEPSNVKRSSSDVVKKHPKKSKEVMKLENSDHTSKEKDHCKSVFYDKMNSAGSYPANDSHSSVAKPKKMYKSSDAHFLPGSSCSKDVVRSKSRRCYENVNAELMSKLSSSEFSGNPSDLNSMNPVMTTATQDSSINMCSKIIDIGERIPTRFPVEHTLVNEEDDSTINEKVELNNHGHENDSGHIYPDKLTDSSKNPSIPDPCLCSSDDRGREEVHISLITETGEKLPPTGDQHLYSAPSSNTTSCDLDLSTSVSSSLSRSSSVTSIEVAQLSENSSPCQQFSEIKTRTKETRTKTFLTAQEIVTSEKTFVDVLRLLSEDFISAIKASSESLGKQIISSAILNQIIKYLPELQKLNEELYEDLNSRILNWENDPRIADIFVKKGPFLKLYTNYIREFNSMVAILDDTRRKNPDFDHAVKDFEASHCAKLALKHFMLKPIQRIPQYRLLLSEYQKDLKEDSPDYKDTSTAILIVQDVAEHANEGMKYGDNLNKLLEVQNSLVGSFEVVTPGRIYLKEGILMKLSRKEMQPRKFFLFSDVLLYTTPVASGYKVNIAIPLSTVKVSNPTKEDFQNEFSIISTQRSFTVSARTEQEKMEWLAAMEEAISNIQVKRHSFSQGKFGSLPIVNNDPSTMDFRLGMEAPVWIPDDRVSMCMICTDEFSLLFRRHHCRGCGKVICGKCSSYEAPLRYLRCKTERVCRECFETLNKDDMGDVVPVPASPLSDSQEEQRLPKQNIKSRFRSFAFEIGITKPVQRPTVLQGVNASDGSAEMSGYLHLWKDRKWRKTWFVLKTKVLYTFKASEDTAAEKSTPLLGYEVAPCETYFQGVEPNLIFELIHHGMPSIIFKTDSPQSRDKWMQAMRNATVP